MTWKVTTAYRSKKVKLDTIWQHRQENGTCDRRTSLYLPVSLKARANLVVSGPKIEMLETI